jgi:hypothetical protein
MLSLGKIIKFGIASLATAIILAVFFVLLSGADLSRQKAVVRAVVFPVKQYSLALDGKAVSFPLPKNSTILGVDGRGVTVVTLSAGKSLYEGYFTEKLPANGWDMKDQLGSSYFYEKGNFSLSCVRRRIWHVVEVIDYQVSFDINR